MACHGSNPEKVKGGFNLLSRTSTLKGGESYGEDVLIPGKGEESILFQLTTRVVEDYEMPPKEANKLSQQQSLWIRDWINAGAPWPDEASITVIQNQFAAGVKVPTSGGLDDEWTNRRYNPEHLWSYRPLTVKSPPEGVHPVDWFIDQKLKTAGLSPAPEARPRELVRRLSHGLTGLPPEPKSIQQFSRNQKQGTTQAVLELSLIHI